MTSVIEMAHGRHRFAALLAGDGNVACDRPLLQTNDWIVAPTLGAIVPGWLLVIPRIEATNCKEWQSLTGNAPLKAIRDVISHLGLAMDEVIWFEHGPARTGTVVGCGLDYAHLHIIMRPQFAFASFAAKAREMASLTWTETVADQPYQKAGSQSYYVAGSGDAAMIATDVEAGGSQFFRRVVASLIENTSTWDYRRHPHAQNIERTIEMFRSLEGAGQRGC